MNSRVTDEQQLSKPNLVTHRFSQNLNTSTILCHDQAYLNSSAKVTQTGFILLYCTLVYNSCVCRLLKY